MVKYDLWLNMTRHGIDDVVFAALRAGNTSRQVVIWEKSLRIDDPARKNCL
jgi:hypothetical protein